MYNENAFQRCWKNKRSKENMEKEVKELPCKICHEKKPKEEIMQPRFIISLIGTCNECIKKIQKESGKRANKKRTERARNFNSIMAHISNIVYNIDNGATIEEVKNQLQAIQRLYQ